MFKISTSGLGTNEIIFQKAESNTTLGFVEVDLTSRIKKDYGGVNTKLKKYLQDIIEYYGISPDGIRIVTIIIDGK
jgi:hypothetical protein